MLKRTFLQRPLAELVLPSLVLAFLILYTYADLLVRPFAGFFWTADGRVEQIMVRAVPEPDLRLGDQLIQVGLVHFNEYRANGWQTLFGEVRPGQQVIVVVLRDGQLVSVSWVFPGFTRQELLYRLVSGWPLPYLFWLAGTITLLSLRPRDVRWKALTAFNFLTAMWLSVLTSDNNHVWGNAILLPSIIWICVPVYLQLHWELPNPLGSLPSFAVWISYGVAAILVVLEWLQALPFDVYAYGFLLAVIGSMALLVAHFRLQPQQRSKIGLLLVIGGLAFVPSIVIGIVSFFNPLVADAGGVLLGLPLLPFAYLYVTYRGQLGGLELRINRLLALYVFVMLVGLAFLVLAAVGSVWLGFRLADAFIGVAFGVLGFLAFAIGYRPFRRFFERRVLGIPQAPAQLLESYAARITTSLDANSLAQLLTAEVLPGLLVRQFAFLAFDDTSRPTVLCAMGLAQDQLPAAPDVGPLLPEPGRHRVFNPPDGASGPGAWVRLALPLELGDKRLGLWLFGRRDPDDYYAQSEVATLRALADQTAIALSNILQTERLRALYQASINQQEAERTTLALELHDEILNQLAILAMTVDERQVSPSFRESYQVLVSQLRHTITGLRPAMLSYGLRPALDELADELSDRAGEQAQVVVDVPESEVRYDPQTELHLYRIVQQAGENALRHGRPRAICIRGELRPERVDLTIEDDGLGFAVGEALDLPGLVANKHFGLAGMFERAALVGGRVEIDSTPGCGTRVHVTWNGNGG